MTRGRGGRRLMLWALLALLAWPALAWALARALVVRVPLAHADALVVLSGSAAYVERTQLAARLWREGRAPLVLLTNDNQPGGWSSAAQRNPLFVERAAAELKDAGVAPERIVVLSQPVSNTYDETALVCAYAAAHDLRAVQFVTSAYHTRRAWWTLQRACRGRTVALGIEPVVPGQQTPGPGGWWLHRRGWQAVAGEYLKFAYYLVHYRAL